MAADENRTKVIADEIARYLVQRPHAADTVDGIRQWWLPRIRPDAVDTEIRQALDHLVQRGIVVANTLPDGNTVYRSTSK
jgi:DNA polymerase III psi subunit